MGGVPPLHFLLALLAPSIVAQTYTTHILDPPPSSCTTTWTDDATCNPLKTALATSNSYLHLRLKPGLYFNKNWSPTSPPKSYHNTQIVQINNKDHIVIEAYDPSNRPILKFDGTGALYIKDVRHLEIRGLTIEGPAGRITGHEASKERQRRSSHQLFVCGDKTCGTTTGQCSTNDCNSCHQNQCTSTANCEWKNSVCTAKALGYYNGNGIAVWPGATATNNAHILVENNYVSKCPGSGIRANKADFLIVRNNVVYDNVWWTTSASSGLVFAESAGVGENTITGNVVYGNRNFMPFYLDDLGSVAGGHEAKDGYSSFNQSYIIDGSGVYITRNQNYQGTMTLSNNTCFDNGINGVVVHKTNNPSVTVVVNDNTIFSNGKTSPTVEGRQAAGGLVINNGPPAGRLSMSDNIVYTSTASDFAFQCFSGCSLSPTTSKDNVRCVGATNPVFTDQMFDDTGTCGLDLNAIRQQYPASDMPMGLPQYSYFPRPYFRTGNLRAPSPSNALPSTQVAPSPTDNAPSTPVAPSSTDRTGTNKNENTGSNSQAPNDQGRTPSSSRSPLRVGSNDVDSSGTDISENGIILLVVGAVVMLLVLVFYVFRKQLRPAPERPERVPELAKTDGLEMNNFAHSTNTFDFHCESRLSVRPKSQRSCNSGGRPSSLRSTVSAEVRHSLENPLVSVEDVPLRTSSTTWLEQLDRETLEYYYYNTVTGASTWLKEDVPNNENIEASEWHVAMDDATGRYYYFNSITNQTQWVEATHDISLNDNSDRDSKQSINI